MLDVLRSKHNPVIDRYPFGYHNSRTLLIVVTRPCSCLSAYVPSPYFQQLPASSEPQYVTTITTSSHTSHIYLVNTILTTPGLRRKPHQPHQPLHPQIPRPTNRRRKSQSLHRTMAQRPRRNHPSHQTLPHKRRPLRSQRIMETFSSPIFRKRRLHSPSHRSGMALQVPLATPLYR